MFLVDASTGSGVIEAGSGTKEEGQAKVFCI
jgi:hypothetical protein